jgi:hypothetical protein
MNIRPSHCFQTTMQRVVFALLITMPALHADTSFTFQNGANGYSGARDISINTQYSQYNGGNGTQWRGDPELGCYSTTGSGSYTARYLVKFGGLSIPAGSKVTSATLTIGLDSWNSGSGNITGFYLSNAWNGDSNRLGWLYRDDTHSWAAAGGFVSRRGHSCRKKLPGASASSSRCAGRDDSAGSGHGSILGGFRRGEPGDHAGE